MEDKADDFKAQILTHKEKTWVLLTPEPQDLRFSPLIEVIDWYNSQLLAKSFKNKKINLAMGEKTLFNVSPLLSATRILVIGLGKSTASARAADLYETIRDTINNLKNSREPDPQIWVAISDLTPPALKQELTEKLSSKFENVTVG